MPIVPVRSRRWHHGNQYNALESCPRIDHGGPFPPPNEAALWRSAQRRNTISFSTGTQRSPGIMIYVLVLAGLNCISRDAVFRPIAIRHISSTYSPISSTRRRMAVRCRMPTPLTSAIFRAKMHTRPTNSPAYGYPVSGCYDPLIARVDKNAIELITRHINNSGIISME